MNDPVMRIINFFIENPFGYTIIILILSPFMFLLKYILDKKEKL